MIGGRGGFGKAAPELYEACYCGVILVADKTTEFNPLLLCYC